MMNANNIDPQTLSTAEFAGLLEPATGNGIGAMDPWTLTRLIKNASAEQLAAVLGRALRCFQWVTQREVM